MFTTSLNAGIPATLASMIRRAFGDCPAKTAAPFADASHRTVSDWLQRRAEPGAWKLLRMVRHPQFRAELRAYLDHIEMEEAENGLQINDITAELGSHPNRNVGALGAQKRAAAVCATAEAVGGRRRRVKL